MAKAPKYAVGIDIGESTMRSVLVQRRGADRLVVSGYAVRPLQQPLTTAEQLGHELQTLLKQMGGGTKNCGVAVSSAKALIRIIEQPQTPPEILRDALRLNGMALLNQDCRGLVLDCDQIVSSSGPAVEGEGGAKQKYLVGGLPREEVAKCSEACSKAGASVLRMQLSPICIFNAFESARPDIFGEKLFFLVDIGHSASVVIVGLKRELILVRQIDQGGKAIMEMLMSLSGESRESLFKALEQEDELVVENSRMALASLAREIGSSIGFVEAQREMTVDNIFVSGGLAKSKALLKLLSEEVRITCESWNPAGRCEVGLSGGLAALFPNDALDLHVAYGAAVEILTGK